LGGEWVINYHSGVAGICGGGLHPTSAFSADSTHTAVEHFQLLVRRSETLCLMSSEMWRVVLTVLGSFLRQSSSVSINVSHTL